MLRLIAILVLTVFSLIGGNSVASPLKAEEVRRELAGAELSFFRDPTGRYSIDEIATSRFAEKFQPLPHGLKLGFTPDVIWVRISLQRIQNAPADWQLEVNAPYINDLRLFARGNNGFTSSQAGDRFPFAEREFAFHNPVFAVSLPDAAPRDFYLRIKTDSTTSAALLLWQPAALWAAGQAELLVFGGFFGMIVMSLLLSVVTWRTSRDRRLLAFVVLTALLIIMVPTQLGLTTQFFLQHSPLLADRLLPWTLGITFATTLLIFRVPLQIRSTYPWLDRVVRVCALLTVMAPLSREFDLYWLLGGPLLQVMFIVGLSLNGWVSWKMWRRKVEGAGYLFAAHAVFMIFLVSGRLSVLGVLPPTYFISLHWMPGLLAFLMLSLIGVVVEVRTSREARFQAEQASSRATELAQQEKQLRGEQTLFFSFVAHELRTPLGVIVAGLKNIRRELTDAGTAMQARLDRLSRAAERMGTMVERHLQLQRLASADFSPRLMSLPPQEPAAEALLQARETYPQRSFVWSIVSNLPDTVRLDAELIMLALANLLANAAKYAPEGTPVRFEISADTLLHYRVIDQGSGIAPDERARLFQVFQRAANTANQSGFGIGLATAQRIAAIHGGTLEYRDGTTGGAVFTLSLPLNNQPDTAKT